MTCTTRLISTLRLFSLIAPLLFIAACETKHADELTQWSTLDALASGFYDGAWTLAQIKTRGDNGIGTFDGLDGEMIMSAGHIYRIDSAGRISEAADTESTPFAVAGFMHGDYQFALPPGSDWSSLTAVIDPQLPSLNHFYLIRVHGRFAKVKTRSVPKQQRPYPPLAEVVKQQPVFEREHISGVMVGLRCPDLAKGLNAPGYHLHFLADNQEMGGHVLEFTASDVTIEMDQKIGFRIVLPDQPGFNQRSFGTVNMQGIEQSGSIYKH